MVRGSYFGEDDIIFKRKRSKTCRSVMESHFLTLSKGAFESVIVSEYPELVKTMKGISQEREERCNAAKKRTKEFLEENTGKIVSIFDDSSEHEKLQKKATGNNKNPHPDNKIVPFSPRGENQEKLALNSNDPNNSCTNFDQNSSTNMLHNQSTARENSTHDQDQDQNNNNKKDSLKVDDKIGKKLLKYFQAAKKKNTLKKKSQENIENSKKDELDEKLKYMTAEDSMMSANHKWRPPERNIEDQMINKRHMSAINEEQLKHEIEKAKRIAKLKKIESEESISSKKSDKNEDSNNESDTPNSSDSESYVKKSNQNEKKPENEKNYDKSEPNNNEIIDKNNASLADTTPPNTDKKENNELSEEYMKSMEKLRYRASPSRFSSNNLKHTMASIKEDALEDKADPNENGIEEEARKDLEELSTIIKNASSKQKELENKIEKIHDQLQNILVSLS